MLSSFGFAIERSFEGTISAIVWIVFVVFILLVIFLWISVPFILLSIKKELKSINEKLSDNKNDGLD